MSFMNEGIFYLTIMHSAQQSFVHNAIRISMPSSWKRNRLGTLRVGRHEMNRLIKLQLAFTSIQICSTKSRLKCTSINLGVCDHPGFIRPLSRWSGILGTLNSLNSPSLMFYYRRKRPSRHAQGQQSTKFPR